MESRLDKASKISFSARRVLKVMFSSFEMTGEKISSISCSIRGLEEVKRLEKWEMKFPPISSLEDTQTVTPHPNDTQYCPLLAPPNQTFQEVTHLGTTLAEVRLTAEF